MRAFDPQVFQQFGDVAAQLREAVLAIGYGRFAVAARVVAQDAEAAAQFGDLARPHIGAGTQRVGQYQHGGVGGAVDDVIQARLAEVGVRHGDS